MSDVAIRPASASDWAQIQQSFAGSVEGPTQSYEAFQAMLSNDDLALLVATVDGSLIGWGKTYHFRETDGDAPAGYYLGGVRVRADSRRQGIGTALTMPRLQWIWERSDTAFYIANAANTGSIELHRRFGFREITRANRFHTTTFDGGLGILFQADKPSRAR